MNEIELVVFDLCGTTVQDNGEVPEAFVAALAQGGIGAKAAEIKEWRGASKREVIGFFAQRQWGTEGLEERIEQVYAGFRQQLEQRYEAGGVRPLAGVEDALQRLRGEGIKLAATTGFYRQVTQLMLERMGWIEGVFDRVVCSDDVRRGRPAPYMIFRAMEAVGAEDVARVVKVGDTPLDILAGQRAGLEKSIGVLTGSGDEASLQAVGASAVLASAAEVPQWLESASKG